MMIIQFVNNYYIYTILENYIFLVNRIEYWREIAD